MSDLPDPPSPTGPDANIRAELRKRAETHERGKSEALDLPYGEVEAQRLVHELRVHQIELEMQNEELREARAEIEAGLERYTDLYDFAPVGYLSLTPDGVILRSNLNGSFLLGTERARLVGMRFGQFLNPEDKGVFSALLKQVFLSGGKQTCQCAVQCAEGGPLWVQIAATRSENWQECRVVLSDISERKRDEATIQAALLEKETLLRELYHRTKNNMQVIDAMLSMQRTRISDPAARLAMLEIGEKIQGMALVHEMLYQAKNLRQIDLKSYIDKLIQLLQGEVETLSSRLVFELDLDSLPVPVEIAMPCGLLLNELISNTLKHAFPGHAVGTVRVRLRRESTDWVLLEVADNGVGLPPGFDARASTSLGIQTLLALTELQMRGEITFLSPPGTTIQVRFRAPLQAASG